MVNRRALERGISLTELVLVAAIGLTLFAMAVPAAQNDDAAGSVARLLVSDAVRARSHARRSWETVTMQVDVNTERWRSLKQNGSPLLSANSDENGWHSAPPGVDFRQLDGTPADLIFLPNGRASASNTVRIHIGSSVWEVRVDAMSAKISADPVDLDGQLEG